MDTGLASFVLLAVILAVTPGADTMVVMKNAVAGGARLGLMTMLGVKLGTLTHAVLASIGIAALVLQFSALYSTIKFAGAIYLGWLGLVSLMSAIKGKKSKVKTEQIAEPKAGKALAQGYLSNVLNPKVVLFYLAVLPQFIGPDDPVLLKSISLGAIHIVASALWLTGVSVFVGAMGAWLARPKVRRALETVAGLALIGFGLRVALSKQ